MRKLLAVAITACAASAATRPAQAQEVLLDWNTGAPAPSGYWAWQEIGWFYTPQQSMWVNFMGTRFGSYGTDRTVTAEIRSAPGADGGVTLASGVFNSAIARTGIGGAFFTAFLLEAGTEYFLGFRNVQLLGANVTGTPGADGPNEWRGSYGTSGLYGYTGTGAYRPILSLFGEFVQADPTVDEPVFEEPFADEIDAQNTTFDEVPEWTDGETQGELVTPEPISMILVGTGLAGVGALRRRRKHASPAPCDSAQ